jgi:GT2 family glycosyltransferase
MSVSIIIPNLNSPVIDQTLASLLGQTRSGQVIEILVIGQDEPGLVRERGPIRFIRTEGAVVAPVSRNIGIRSATGDLLGFVDSDCVVTATWLERLLAHQSAGKLVVSGGVSLQTEGYRSLCYNLGLFSDMLVTSPAGVRASVPSLNLLVAREVVDRVGFFSEDLPRSHDVEWSCRIRRAGYRIHFAPGAEVIHLPGPRTWREVLNKFYRSGFYSMRVRLEHQDMLYTPRFFEHHLVFSLSIPVLSASVTMATYTRNRSMFRYLHTAPAVYACKVAWCLGASRQIRSWGK